MAIKAITGALYAYVLYALCIICIMHRCVNVCMCIMYHVSLYICNIYIYAIYQ